MVVKTIVKGKDVRLCDICGEVIELESRDSLFLTIQQGWWKTFGYENVEICKKHKKETMDFIKKIKHDVSVLLDEKEKENG